MNTHISLNQVLFRGLLVLLLVTLALQSFEINATAAPIVASGNLQTGGDVLPLTCSSSTSPTKHCDIQAVLLIDDSGSMLANDPSLNRRYGAKHFVDALATQYYSLASQASSTGLPDIQVAVIHFNESNLSIISWMDINPANPADWENVKQPIYEAIDQPKGFTRKGTSFVGPLTEALKLFDSAKVGSNCIRRTVMLFSDGTPETDKGIIRGTALDNYFSESITPLFNKQPPLPDEFYLTGFKVRASYWDEAQPKWAEAAKLLGTSSDSNRTGVPYIQLMSNPNLTLKLAERMDDIATSLNAGSQVGNTDLSSDQNLPVTWTVETSQLQLNQTGTIKFQLMDASGSVIKPDNSSANGQTWSVSISQGGEEIILQWSGDSYQFSWTPKNLGIYSFNLNATLVGSDGNSLINCQGGWSLLIVNTSSSTIVNVIVGPADEVITNSVTVHVNLKYLDQKESPHPVIWDNSASVTDPSGGRKLNVHETTIDEKNGLYEITVEPVNDARQIVLNLKANATINNNNENILNSSYPIFIHGIQPCACNAVWQFWFWPIVIFLVLALLILIVLRFTYLREKQEWERRSLFAIQTLNLLFLPFSIMLVIAILNRLWWCCVIPLWLFLIVLLVLIIIVLPIRFPRWPSIWWLVMILLLIVLLVVISILFNVSFLWLLLILIVIGVVRWILLPILFILPSGSPMILSLVMAPECVPSTEEIILPFNLNIEGGESEHSTLAWNPIVTAGPDLKNKRVSARVETINVERGEYELHIDPVTDVQWFDVRVSATVRFPDQDVSISGKTTRIEVCPPDDLKELEGIGPAVEKLLHEHQIFTFRRLAKTKWQDIDQWLNTETRNKRQTVKNSSWGKMMNPKTWPQQAKLRDKAMRSGTDKDWKSYLDYLEWLFDGIEADEYARPEEENTRTEALKWPEEKGQISQADIDAARERHMKK